MALVLGILLAATVLTVGIYRFVPVPITPLMVIRLVEQWSELGDGLLELQGSHLLGEALERRSGQVDCHVLERQYSHLSPLVGSV